MLSWFTAAKSTTGSDSPAIKTATSSSDPIFSTLTDRVILNAVDFVVPDFYPLPPIRYDQSLDPLHGRMRSWACNEPGYVDAFEISFLDYMKRVFGLDFRSGTKDPVSGVWRIPEATAAPCSRQSPPADRLMFDSEYRHRAGEWGAREGGWNVLMETDGPFGGEKTGSTRKAGSILQCMTFYFTDADPEDLTNPRKVERMTAISYNPTYTYANEWGKLNMLAETRLTFEDGRVGQLTETITQNKIPGSWVIRSRSFFNKEISSQAPVNSADDKDLSKILNRFSGLRIGVGSLLDLGVPASTTTSTN